MKIIARVVSTANAADAQACHNLSAADATHKLHAANQRLLALRQQNGTRQRTAPATPPAIHKLPKHVGWGSAALSHLLRAADACVPSKPLAVTVRSATPTAPQAAPQSAQTTIKAHPTLLTALLKAELAAVGRVWLLSRHLDADGRGWLDVNVLRVHLTQQPNDSAKNHLKICGWRRLRQLLQAGKGVFWDRDKFGRIWLYSTARVAANLGIAKLQGNPILLPISALCGSIKTVRAHFYASFHSSRGEQRTQAKNKVSNTHSTEYSAPISRLSLEIITSTSARSQATYEHIVRLEKRRCYAIGAPKTAQSERSTAWERGAATFTFVDHHGEQGKPGRAYMAWHLPNQYQSCHTHAPMGRTRKINRWLKHNNAQPNSSTDLVETIRVRGNGDELEQPIKRVFYPNGAAAVKASRKQESTSLYWTKPQTKRARQSQSTSQFWWEVRLS